MFIWSLFALNVYFLAFSAKLDNPSTFLHVWTHDHHLSRTAYLEFALVILAFTCDFFKTYIEWALTLYSLECLDCIIHIIGRYCDFIAINHLQDSFFFFLDFFLGFFSVCFSFDLVFLFQTWSEFFNKMNSKTSILGNDLEKFSSIFLVIDKSSLLKTTENLNWDAILSA